MGKFLGGGLSQQRRARGKAIRMRRTELGLSQVELAEKSGISLAELQRLEAGDFLSASALAKLREVIGTAW